MERNQNMSQDFNIGDRIQTIVSPLNDENNGRKATPIGAQGTIITFMREKTRVLILFDETAPDRHQEATDYGISYAKAYRRCWWVDLAKLALAKQLTPEEKQVLKEQSIIEKCKQLDKNFKDYQAQKKRYGKAGIKFISFSKFCKGNY